MDNFNFGPRGSIIEISPQSIKIGDFSFFYQTYWRYGIFEMATLVSIICYSWHNVPGT